MRSGMHVVNGLDQSVSIRFNSGEAGHNIVTIQAGATREFSLIKCFGELDFQYESGVPTTGLLTVSVW